jgi:hypothetical protein
MKAFYSFLLLTFFTVCSLNADIAPIKAIDDSKRVIQIGMFKDKQNTTNCIQKYKNDYALFTKPYKNLDIVYAVNIEQKNLRKSFIDIRENYVDAFVNNKVSFKNYKKAKASLVASKTRKSIPICNTSNVNGTVDIIQIGMFAQENNLFDTIRKYGKTNTMMIKPYQNTYIAYIMNTNNAQTKSDLQIVKKSYDDAFVNEKIHLYSKPQKVAVIKPKIVEKVIEKKIEKPKFDKPIDIDKMTTSFENLPYAIFGRM